MRSLSRARARDCLLLGIGVAFLASCTAESTAPEKEEGCLPNDKFFAEKVWAPILSTNCLQCHNAQGAASNSDFVLRGEAETGFLDTNLRVFSELAELEVDGTSVLLLKPTMQRPHEGGMRLEIGSEDYKALEEMIARTKQPVVCTETENDDYFAQVVMEDNTALLRKVTLNLAGRLPTPEEYQAVRQDGFAGLDWVLDGVMEEEGFYNRLKEVYNDQLFTDRYLRNRDGLQLLDDDDYPTVDWYSNEMDDDLRDDLSRWANLGVAREPLELITHVVRNDLPFTEVVTADYIMVNSFSARSYGVSEGAYVDGTDASQYNPTRFYPANVPGVPHAGVMTSHIFLNRFPTTPTNVNRHRSRMVFKLFLATDVLKLAERPVDPTQIADHNPTMNNPACSVCHATMDPIAGAFQNWDDRGRYRPVENWLQELRAPGFGEETIPSDQSASSLQWLGNRIAQDERFATAAIHTVYRALTGEEPLSGDTATLRAFTTQEEHFKTIRADFIANGYDFKHLVKAMAKSPYVRAKDMSGAAANPDDYKTVGTAKLLTPEQLDRKIEAVTGYPWERFGRRQLGVGGEFSIFYGGIDSDAITKRITEPNGVMASIATRMSNEMSCVAVPHDFTHPMAERRLFPHVEMSFVPEDDNGFEIPAGVAAIRENIKHLHRHLLGEEASVVELDRSYDLFVTTWREGKQAIADETVSVDSWGCRAENDYFTGEELPEERRVRRDEDYTLRAWMAVTAYLLSDYDFLYE